MYQTPMWVGVSSADRQMGWKALQYGDLEWKFLNSKDIRLTTLQLDATSEGCGQHSDDRFVFCTLTK